MEETEKKGLINSNRLIPISSVIVLLAGSVGFGKLINTVSSLEKRVQKIEEKLPASQILYRLEQIDKRLDRIDEKLDNK